MKLLHFLLLLCIISNYIFSSQRNHRNTKPTEKLSFIIEELNYFDQQEVDRVCSLFEDKYTQRMLDGVNQNKIREALKDYKSNDINIETSGRFITCTAIDIYNSTLCGLLIVSQNRKDKTATYHDIVVAKDFRQKGIASSLMSYAEQYYLAPSIAQISLEVLDINKPAIKCYEKHGFYIPLSDQIFSYIDKARGINDNQIAYNMHKNLKPLSYCPCPNWP
jgi:ribosomal protein S18 acetylase RimI-like enzyme